MKVENFVMALVAMPALKLLRFGVEDGTFTGDLAGLLVTTASMLVAFTMILSCWPRANLRVRITRGV